MTSIKQYSSRYWLFKWKGLLHRQISTYSHCYRINSKYLKMISRYKPDTEKKNMYGTLFLVQNTNMCIYSNNHKNLCHPEPIHPHSGCACTIIKTYFIVSETFFFLRLYKAPVYQKPNTLSSHLCWSVSCHNKQYKWHSFRMVRIKRIKAQHLRHQILKAPFFLKGGTLASS